ARLRRELASEPDRSLFEHLRAPPAAALENVARWRVEGPAEGAPVELRTPAALEAGVHLLTLSARGVTVPVPLVVSRATALLRRGTGPTLLWLVEREQGTPL